MTRALSSSTVVCAVSGDVDLRTAPRLRDRLVAQLRPAGPDLVADLGDVGFLGAAGLTALVAARSAADACGVRFCLVARTRPVLRPLAVTGLLLAFDVYVHVDDAPARGAPPDHRLPRS
ncbi:STAS domain-containing protein [Actinosynnema sp. CA-248983]